MAIDRIHFSMTAPAVNDKARLLVGTPYLPNRNRYRDRNRLAQNCKASIRPWRKRPLAPSPLGMARYAIQVLTISIAITISIN
jgi:hypothetical protein